MFSYTGKYLYQAHSYQAVNDNYTEQIITFKGAKNTKYSLRTIIGSASLDSSFGIVGDYAYFYGMDLYEPTTTTSSQVYGWHSTLTGLKSVNLMDFNNISTDFITDENGLFKFLIRTCVVEYHYAEISLSIWLNGYENIQKSVHTILKPIHKQIGHVGECSYRIW